MSTSDQRLEKLKKLLEVASEDVATPADLVKLTEALVTVIAKERDKMIAKLEAQRNDTDGAIADALRALDEKERSIRSLIDQLSRSTADTTTKLVNRLSAEVKRLERKIPSRTDLSGIEAKIQAIEEALTTVPTEITANPEAVRDALELLFGDNRFDKSFIRGLDDYDDLRELVKTVHPSNFNLGKVIRSLQAGTNISIDNSNPNMPVISATVTGGGYTIETPTGTVNGSNTTFTVSDTPQFIVYYGTTYFEGDNGYQRTGLTITMPFAPTISDQFKAFI